MIWKLLEAYKVEFLVLDWAPNRGASASSTWTDAAEDEAGAPVAAGAALACPSGVAC